MAKNRNFQMETDMNLSTQKWTNNLSENKHTSRSKFFHRRPPSSKSKTTYFDRVWHPHPQSDWDHRVWPNFYLFIYNKK